MRDKCSLFRMESLERETGGYGQKVCLSIPA